MSNAENDYQQELKQLSKEELIELVNSYRNLAMDLDYKYQFRHGKCNHCRSPLNDKGICNYNKCTAEYI